MDETALKIGGVLPSTFFTPKSELIDYESID